MFTDHVSHSSLSLYRRCPAAFKLHYTKPGSPPSYNMIAGQKNHEKIAESLKVGDIGSLPLGPRLKTFCKNILGNPIKFIEHRFSLDLLSLKVEGIVDAANIFGDTCVICDWKKSSSPFVDEYQLKLYGLFLISAYPQLETVHGFFGYVQNDYWDSFCYFKPDLKSFGVELSNLIDEILADDKFLPRPGSFCQRCRHVEVCPAAGEFKIANPRTVKQAVAMAERAIALESLVDKTKEYVKTFMLENSIESLPVNDSRYYISSVPIMRQSKFKSEKDKVACNKILELAMSGETSEPLNTVEPQSNQMDDLEKPRLGLSTKTADNVIASQLQREGCKKVKMTELVELLKRNGRLPQDATSTAGSHIIKELMGVPFISATEEQKQDLKARLTVGI